MANITHDKQNSPQLSATAEPTLDLKDESLVAFYKQGSLVKVKVIGQDVEAGAQGKMNEGTFDRLNEVLSRSEDGLVSFTRNYGNGPSQTDIEYGKDQNHIVVSITPVNDPASQKVFDVTEEGMTLRR